jgi:hypothetical protein
MINSAAEDKGLVQYTPPLAQPSSPRQGRLEDSGDRTERASRAIPVPCTNPLVSKPSLRRVLPPPTDITSPSGRPSLRCSTVTIITTTIIGSDRRPTSSPMRPARHSKSP